MVRMQPFRGWRPASHLAARVACPPYDVVEEAAGRALVAAEPWSFLRVTRPELAMPSGTPSTAPAAYAAAQAALAHMVTTGLLIQDDAPSLYVYTMDGGQGPDDGGSHTQTGIVMQAAIADYEAGHIKKHELTRPDKEADRATHIAALQAQTGKVMLVHRDAPPLLPLLAAVQKQPAVADVVDPEGVRHRLWAVTQPQALARITAALAAAGPLYIADGHHRAAAAARVAGRMQASSTAQGPSQELAGPHASLPAWRTFLAVAFPASQVQVLAYNRVIADLQGHTPASLLVALSKSFEMTDTRPGPVPPRQFSMYLAGRWHSLRLRPATPVAADAVGCLDVSVLQAHVLAPLLGIEDPRRDSRIGFVGGHDAARSLAARVDAGGGVAFMLSPVRLDDLFAVADAGDVMPPKSTWFAPKVRDGLVVSCY